MIRITLAGKEYDVPPLPYGKLKKAIPLMNSWRGAVSEDALTGVGELLALVLNLPIDVIDEMPITFKEIADAVPKIGEAMGLISGEEKGQSLTGTNTTQN